MSMTTKHRVDRTAKPFVKWAGGKSQLLDEIQRRLPSDIGQQRDLTYIEPFVGGGAVLFWILQRYPNIRRAVINDINPKLICTYRIVKERVEELISVLQVLESRYQELAEEERKAFFLAMRERFNSPQTSELDIAALFIFLNRTCFNGLYRVNSKGLFNVPFGRYANPTICNGEILRLDSELLQRVTILNGDYEESAQYVTPNTFMYFDPPYRPLSETSSFTSYAAGVFNDDEQVRLKRFADLMVAKGCKVLLSNSDPKGKKPDDDFFDSLYDGYVVERVYATRMVNSNASKRGRLTELMIRNHYRIGNEEAGNEYAVADYCCVNPSKTDGIGPGRVTGVDYPVAQRSVPIMN